MKLGGLKQNTFCHVASTSGYWMDKKKGLDFELLALTNLMLFCFSFELAFGTVSFLQRLCKENEMERQNCP